MDRNRALTLVFVAALAASLPLATSVAASDEPTLEVYLADNIVEPGEETSVQLEIRNEASPYEDDGDVGEAPDTEARDVTVSLDGADTPIEVKTAETPTRTMSAQALLSEEFVIAIDETAEAGTYELEATIEYTFGEDESRTETVPVEVVIEEQARFDTRDVTSDLVVGDRGVVTLELENTGVENASDAVVQFDSPDPNVQTVDPTTDESELQTAGSEGYVGTWEVNETTTVRAAMDVDPDAVARTYPVSATVDFRDEAGVKQSSRELRVGAKAVSKQRFTVDEVEPDLHVGEDGTIEGTILNEGPNPVESAVIVVDDGEDSIVPDIEAGLGSGSNVYPRRTQYALDDLEPGESKPFAFRVGVGSEAEPGPQVMEVDVRYRNVHDDIRTTDDPIDVPLDIKPERDEFDVEILNGTQAIGDSQDVSLRVTNTKDETLTDVEAKLYTNAPLDNHDDEGFIPALDPGESATVTFEVEVEDGATPQTYPLRVDFRYDDQRSNSQLSDTYRIPLDVVEPDGRFSALAIVIAAGILGALAAVGWRFRDRIERAIDSAPVLGDLSDTQPLVESDTNRGDSHAPIDDAAGGESTVSEDRTDAATDAEMGEAIEDERLDRDEAGTAESGEDRQDAPDSRSGDREHGESDHEDGPGPDTGA